MTIRSHSLLAFCLAIVTCPAFAQSDTLTQFGHFLCIVQNSTSGGFWKCTGTGLPGQPPELVCM
jgi:hypothetical protein